MREKAKKMGKGFRKCEIEKRKTVKKDAENALQ